MSNSKKRSQEYKDFRFRRRYDYFLRFRLQNAKPEEIIEAARELGFKINSNDLTKTKQGNTNFKNADHIKNQSIIDRLIGFF